MALLTMRDGTAVSTDDFDHAEDWHGFIADAMSPAGWAASPFAVRLKARRGMA